MIVTAGSTNVSTYFYVTDDVGGTAPGEPSTGLTHTDVTSASYVRQGAARAAAGTLSTLAAADSAHSDGGFKEVDATNAKGLYRFDPPDAAFATGVDSVVVHLVMADGYVASPKEIDILDVDLRDTVRGGLTALPNVVAGGNGGLPLGDASGDVTVATINTGVITATSIAADAIGASELAADAVTEIRDAITGGAYALDTDANGRIRIVDGTGAGEVNTSSGAVEVFNLQTGAITDVSNAVTNVLIIYHLDHLMHTALPASQIVDNSVMAKLVSASATAAWDDYDNTTDSHQALRDNLATATALATVDSNVDAILLDTAEIGAAGAGLTAIPDMATATALATVDTVVDSILIDTAEIGVAGAGLTALATAANLATVDTVVDSILVDTAEIGTAGAGLTDLGGMSTGMKAEVEAECTDALEADGLDHLVSAAVIGTDVVDNSIVAKLASKSATADWDDYVNTTDSMQAQRDDLATAASIAALNNVSVADILTTQMTEAYAADGAAPTIAQALLMIQQSLGEFAIAGTTLTVKKLDGSTTAATFTLDDATTPTSTTRAT